jgi:hypothetical protein
MKDERASECCEVIAYRKVKLDICFKLSLQVRALRDFENLPQDRVIDNTVRWLVMLVYRARAYAYGARSFGCVFARVASADSTLS